MNNATVNILALVFLCALLSISIEVLEMKFFLIVNFDKYYQIAPQKCTIII